MVGESHIYPTITPNEINHDSSSRTSSNGWNTVPPSSMPWSNSPSLQQNRVTRFSGDFPMNYDQPLDQSNLQISLWNSSEPNLESIKRTKRKCADVLEEPLRKHLITEEKITAHMSQLQISGYKSPQEKISPNPIETSAAEDTSNDIFEKLRIKDDSRVVLSEEYKSLRQESVLPPALLEHLTKPSMALVLWQPPGNAVSSIISAVINRERDVGHRRVRAMPPDPITEDTNNNEPMNNLNWDDENIQQPNRQPNDIEMDEQDL